MTSSQELSRAHSQDAAEPPSPQDPASPARTSSNHRHRKNIHQAAQIHHQRQPVVVPQHSAAMRHVCRRLIEQRLLGRRKCADHFVGGNAQPQDLRDARRLSSAATTTCFGNSPGRRPSVNAISISGTMVPRRLNTPIRNAGASGMRVTIGQSTTSSTSNTEKQNRSRPARKTQYCRSGRRSSEKTSLSRNAPPSSSGGKSRVFRAQGDIKRTFSPR